MSERERVWAVGLVSGGLASVLAMKLVRDQGIEVVACDVTTAFCDRDDGTQRPAPELPLTAGVRVKLVRVDAGSRYVDLVRSPRHGYGRALNPCQDCRVFAYRAARRVMEQHGARFLVTGDVLDGLPTRHRLHQLRCIDEETGLADLVLRPLSELLLPPTRPEREGWVDRERLLDIGRSSRSRIADLAAAEGLRPVARGACPLTETRFAQKLQDAIRHGQDSPAQLGLLSIGCHYRVSPGAKLVVGESAREKQLLLSHGGPGKTLLSATAQESPVGLLDSVGRPPLRSDVMVAARLLLRHACAAGDVEYRVIYGQHPFQLTGEVRTQPLSDAEVGRHWCSSLLDWSDQPADLDWLECRPA